jgi:hypothetical protein
MNALLYYISAIVFLIAFFMVMAIRDVISREFYRNPVGKRCRYKFSGKWIKGVVEWNNGDYWYMTPDERKQATDLVHRRNIKPVYWEIKFKTK